jgi:ABC-type Fe3+/spermidine/putrescine transport system ATPase subunit
MVSYRLMSTIRLESLSKQFGSQQVVKRINLEVSSGELFFLLGPSGCGKSTLLRMIAGLEKPTSGEIYLNEKRITDLPPHKRGIGMVFQQYALWPHLTVYGNIAFGLQAQRINPSEIARRVNEVLDQVHLQDLESRYPHELSGGQQQRVALARALAPNPGVILLDEPLSNLDTRLRDSIRRELADIHSRLKVTMIYVTHDQEDALALADRVAIMKDGAIRQVGTPYTLYHSPIDPFVGSFMGPTNLFPCSLLVGSEEKDTIRCDLLGNTVPVPRYDAALDIKNTSLSYSVRPEDVRVNTPYNAQLTADQVGCPGQITTITLRGGWSDIEVLVQNPSSPTSGSIKVASRMHHGEANVLHPGDAVVCSWNTADAILLPG